MNRGLTVPLDLLQSLAWFQAASALFSDSVE
jgi:hypothetical protein